MNKKRWLSLALCGALALSGLSRMRARAEFAGAEVVTVEPGQDLEALLNDESGPRRYVLGCDWALDKMLNITRDGVSLDLGGHTLYAGEDFTYTFENDRHLVNIEGSGVRLEGGTLRAGAQNKQVLNLYRAGAVTLAGLTLDHTAAYTGAPLVVNGSGALVEGRLELAVGPNSWYGMNLDPKEGTARLTFGEGSRVVMSGPAAGALPALYVTGGEVENAAAAGLSGGEQGVYWAEEEPEGTPAPEETPTPEATPTPDPEPEATPTPEVSPAPETTPAPEVSPEPVPEEGQGESGPEPGPESTPVPEASPAPLPETGQQAGQEAAPTPEATPTPQPAVTPTLEQEATHLTARLELEARMSGQTARAEIRAHWLEEAVRQAVERASREGLAPAVRLEVTPQAGALGLEVQLPAGGLRTLSGQAGARLTVACGPASVSLDEEALRALLEKAGGELTLSVRAAEAHTLTQAQAQAAGEWPAYHLEVRSGGENIARFGQGLARVSLPYEGEGPVQVLHLDEEGAASPRATWQEEGRVVFETGHFSVYAIAPAEADEPAPEAPEAEVPEAEEAQGQKGQTPAPGFWLGALALGLGAGGLAALGRKRG